MSWATHYIQQLQQGQTIQFRPRGNSMTGKINSGQLVTVEPIKISSDIQVGDVVLCKVHGRHYLHLVKAIDGHPPSNRFKIGNNHGYINGWCGGKDLYGKVIKIDV